MNAPSGSTSNETLRPHRGDNADVVTTLNDSVGSFSTGADQDLPMPPHQPDHPRAAFTALFSNPERKESLEPVRRDLQS